MPELYVPEDTEKDVEQKEIDLQVTYEATENDEKNFFLMYHMSIAPSEVGFDIKDEEKRDWLLARFMMQKQIEREQMIQQRMLSGLDLNNLKV